MPAESSVDEARTAFARATYVRVTPMKARRVIALIRNLPARQAQSVLQFAPQAAAEQVGKVLASAIANAEHNHQLDPETLFVRAAYVDEGPTLKRFRPRAQGRAYRINKRTSHITVEVESVEQREAAPRARTQGSRSRTQAAPATPASRSSQKQGSK